MRVRQAVKDDVLEMSSFLQQLAALCKRTSPSDEEFVYLRYIQHPDNIRCSVAEDEDGTILGFQILTKASKGNSYGVAPGWGIIGTHVRPEAARRGVGKVLFAATCEAAKKAGLGEIDATIPAENPAGLAFYDALGFRTYRTSAGNVCKRYEVEPQP